MKKYLQLLTNKDIKKYLVLLLVCAAGICIKGFWGGFLAGATGPFLLLAIVGKAIFSKTVARIDKQVKDHLVNQ